MFAIARITLAILGMGALGHVAAAPPRPPVTVFAAASLTDALGAVGRAYTARTSTPVRFSFASSAAVARQVVGGARADVFFSADREWMDYVAARGLLAAGTRNDVVTGRLVLIAPRASRASLRIAPNFPIVAALGARGRLAVADPAYVPAGRYARAALASFGVWNAVAPRLARADNVRVALSYVARGEAPLGIVYESDARAEPGVRIVGVFPLASHPRIVYPAAVLRRAGPGAAAFLAFARSPAGLAIFARYGFVAAR